MRLRSHQCFSNKFGLAHKFTNGSIWKLTKSSRRRKRQNSNVVCCQIVLAPLQHVANFFPIIWPDYIYHKFPRSAQSSFRARRGEEKKVRLGKYFATHLKERVLVDPSDDHVCTVNVLASGEAEADVAVSFDLHLDDDVRLLNSPQQPKVLVQVDTVVPTDFVRRAVGRH